MEIDKYVVILSSKKGGKNHLKIALNKDKKTADLHLGKQIKNPSATLYIFGDEITKQTLYREKQDVKVSIMTNAQIDVLLADGEETYTGSTGKTPPEHLLLKRVHEYEKEQKTKAENLVEENNENTEKTTEVGDKTDKNFDGQIADESCEKTDDHEQICDEESSDLKVQPFSAEEVTALGKNQEEHEQMAKNKVGVEEESKGRMDEAKVFSFDTVSFDGTNFYLSVKPQLDELFVCYPEEETLCNFVPNSRWVHIATEDGFYVVGIVKDMESVSYICYGVPGKMGVTPPDEIKDFCVWLPVFEGEGYWIIYQDALTGKCLK